MSKKKIADVEPMAYVNFAREYLAAAECLVDHKKNLRNPTYFLYFHTLELLLKAYLRVEGKSIVGTQRSGRDGHKLTELYEECRDLGLVIGTSDKFGIRNIVALLERGNEFQGFRYFNLESSGVPELGWTREVVVQLMRTVELYVEARSGKSSGPGPAVKFEFVIGKPRKQGK